jgi:thiol-disulfide isomerase/thioredoxin
MDWKSPKLWGVIALLIFAIAFLHESAGMINPTSPTSPALQQAQSSSGDVSPSNSKGSSRDYFLLVPRDKQLQFPDFSLHPVSSPATKLSAAASGGFVVIDIWASYCGPCREELPVLDSIRLKYQSKGIAFFALNDYDSADVIKQYAAQSKLGITMIADQSHQITSAIGSSVIPVTVVLDKNRRIMTGCEGYDPDMDKDLPAALDELLAKHAKSSH